MNAPRTRHSRATRSLALPLGLGLAAAVGLLVGGSPGAGRPAPVRAQAGAPAVYIAEIAWMGRPGATDDEWLLLAGTATEDLDLSGWRLRAEDGTPDIALQGILPAGGHLLLERTDDSSAPPLADLVYSGALGNGGEDLRLRDAAGSEVDRAGRAGQWFSGETGLGRTMLRRQPEVPGDQPGAWGMGPPGGTPRNSQMDRDGDGHLYSPNIDWTPGPAGAQPLAEDCDDAAAAVHPGAPEALNARDDDCDREIDEDFELGELDYSVHFSDPERLWAHGPSDDISRMEAALLAFIEGAQESLDAAIYELARPRLADALIAAHARGVRVRVVADDEKVLREEDDKALFDRLKEAGIPVVPDPFVSHLQHNKFAVADGARVWTGSVNWTRSGMTYNQENALELRSPQVAAAYAIEFDEMFRKGRFATRKVDDTPHRFRFAGGVSLELRFAPSDQVARAIGQVLEGAQEDLAFAMFFWTLDPLADIVLSKTARGLGFRGVWDAVGEKNQASEDDRFCAAGLPVKHEVFGGKVHDKLAVIDAEGERPVVIAGSYNWTAAAEEGNDENTLIISGHRALARAYRAEIDRLWQALPEAALCAHPGAESGLPACDDGIDNDYDERVDLADPGCRESTVTACLDGVDNDGDGRVDQADLDCFRAPTATPGSIAGSPTPGSDPGPSPTAPHATLQPPPSTSVPGMPPTGGGPHRVLLPALARSDG